MLTTILETNGYAQVEPMYSHEELQKMIQLLEATSFTQQFGVREILQRVPGLVPLVLTPRFKKWLQGLVPQARLIKSLYFDKPPTANWIVNWHQDLTINVKGNTADPNYQNWRRLPERTVVQAPLTILERMVTVRIHLDDCTKDNGALRVVPGSHDDGIQDLRDRTEELNKKAVICELKAGAMLLMKPLIFHASRRTENAQRRRVIHLEFCDQDLAEGVEWLENITLH